MSITEKAKNIKKYLDSVRETGYDVNGVKWASEIEYLEHIIKTIEYQARNEPVPELPIVRIK